MDIKQRLEAILLAANRPLQISDFLELLELESDDEARVVAALYELQDEYKERSINLVEVSSGFRVQIDQAFSNDIAKLWEVKPLKLSKLIIFFVESGSNKKLSLARNRRFEPFQLPNS